MRLWAGALPPDVYFRRPQAHLPYPLDQPECVLFARGRHALWHGVTASGLQPGDEILTPAYNCGSEVQALSDAGLVCRFYDAGATLAPDEGELDSLVGPKTRALLLIHYLGFPQAAAHWRNWCEQRELLLIEDCAPAWMASVAGHPVGSFGDVAIFSLRKSLPLPDGGALIVRGQAPSEPGRDGSGVSALGKRHLQWLMTRSGYADALLARFERDRDGEDFVLGDPASGPSTATRFLLPRLACLDVAELRRAHYRRLLEDLGERVPSPFSSLPEGASPLAFPLGVERDPGVGERLDRAGIEARPLWPHHHPLVSRSFPHAATWRRHFIALPVHQGLRESDLERVIRAVRGDLRNQAATARAEALKPEPIDDLSEIRDEWSELADRAGNLFATWEWNSVWWRHFGRDGRLLASAYRDARGELVAVVPLYMAVAGPARVIRFLGHGQGDRLGPVCSPENRPQVADSLRRALRSSPLRRALVVGEQLPAEEGWSALLDAQALTRESSPALQIEARSWDEFLAGQSSSLRKKVRYEERRLEREHGLRYRLVEEAEELPAALDALFALHGARWGEKGTKAFAGAEAFHREFAACALERGWLRLWLLEIEGRPAAAWYGFRYGGADWHYQSGRDVSWDRYSVGSVLLAHTIRDCIEAGVTEYRFLRGGEAYKQRFANSDPGLETIALPHGVAARAALLAARGALRLPQAGRARIARALG